MMIKHLRHLLRAFWKEHASAQIKLHKSKLLIYDEHLKKYVSAEELLIPGETKKGQKDSATVLLSKSKEFILFDLLLKKFINPNLDLLTPGINNVNQLINICDFRVKQENLSTSSTDYFWGKKKGSNKHNIPALPPVHDTKHDTQEPSPSKVGWAGQVTKKPASNPRPEHRDTSCSIGPGKDPPKRKAPKKKERNKVCDNVKQDQENALEDTDTGVNEGGSEVKTLKEIGFQEEDCFPLSKDEGKHVLQKPCSTDKSVKSLSSTKEKQNVFKKICSQLFSSEKFVGKTNHKVKVSEGNESTREVESQSYKPNKSCKKSKTNLPSTNNITNNSFNASENDSKPSKINCKKNYDHKALSKSRQNTSSSICSENKPSNDSCKSKITKNDQEDKSLKKVTSNSNQDACNKKVCTAKAEVNVSVRQCVSASKNQTSQHKQTLCSKSSKTKCCDTVKDTKPDSENVKTEKDCFENKNVKCSDDVDIDQMKKECKKALAQRQPSPCKQQDILNISDSQSARKITTDKADCDKECCSTINIKYNFMVCPKANFQKSWKEINLAQENQKSCNDTSLSSKRCEASTRIINKLKPKEQKIPVCNNINTNNSCQCSGDDSVQKVSSTSKPVKGSLSLPDLKFKKLSKDENIKSKCSRLKAPSKKKIEFGSTKLTKAENKSNTSNKLEGTTKCKTVQIEPQKKKKCPTVDNNKNLKSQCQHIEPQVTEKLQRITQGKCLEEANLPEDLSKHKSDTYMGFKIKKSSSETKQRKKISHKVSKTKCSNSKLNEKHQAEVKADCSKDKPNSANESLSRTRCTTPKKKQQILNVSKSDQCINKNSRNENSSQGTCSNNKKEIKSKYKTNISTDKEIKNNDRLCSNTLKKEVRGKSVQRDCQAKRVINNSEDCNKTVYSQPPDGEIISRKKARKVEVNKSKHPVAEKVINEEEKCLCNNTNSENVSQDSKEKDISAYEEPCVIKEEECLSNKLREEQSLCESTLLNVNKESLNQCETIEDADYNDAIKNTDTKCPSSEKKEKCENKSSLELENKKFQTDVDTCKETNIGRETETENICCSKPIQDIGDKSSKSAVLDTGSQKKANKSKTDKKAKTKDGLNKKNKLRKSKSSDSSKKPWKRSVSKQSNTSASAAICTSEQSNRKLKQTKTYSEKKIKNRSKDAPLKPLHKHNSSPNLSKSLNSNKSVNNLQSNKLQCKEIKETKQVTDVKKSVVCSQSSTSIETQNKQNIVTKALSKNKSEKLIKKIDSQKTLKEKESSKLCSLHTLQKRVTENPVKQSKRVEIKSFSELKSVSNPELNKLAVKASTKDLSKILNGHLTNFKYNNKQIEEKLNFIITNQTAKYKIYGTNIQEPSINSKTHNDKGWKTKTATNSKEGSSLLQDKLISKPPVSALIKMYKEYQGSHQLPQEKVIHKIKKDGEAKVKNILTINSRGSDYTSNLGGKHTQINKISSDLPLVSKKENKPLQDKHDTFAQSTHGGYLREKYKAGTVIKATNRSLYEKNQNKVETKAAQEKLPNFNTVEEKPNLIDTYNNKIKNCQQNLKTHDSNQIITKQPVNTAECSTEAKSENYKNKSLNLSSNIEDALNPIVIFKSKTETTQKKIHKRTHIHKSKSIVNHLEGLKRAESKQNQHENELKNTIKSNSSLSKPMSGLYQMPKSETMYTKEDNVQENIIIKEKRPDGIDLKQVVDNNKAQPSSKNIIKFSSKIKDSSSVKLSKKPQTKVTQMREGRKPSLAIESNTDCNTSVHLNKEDENKNTYTKQTKPESILVRNKTPKLEMSKPKSTPSNHILENSMIEQQLTTQNLSHNKYKQTQEEKVYKTVKTTKSSVKVSSHNSFPTTGDSNLKKFQKPKPLADKLDSNTNKATNSYLKTNLQKKNATNYLSTLVNSISVENIDQDKKSKVSIIKNKTTNKNNENEIPSAKLTPELLKRTDFENLDVKNELEDKIEGSQKKTCNLKPIKKSPSDKRLKKISRKDPLLKNKKRKNDVNVIYNGINVIKNPILMRAPNTKERHSNLTFKTKVTRNRAIKSKTYVVKHCTKTSVSKESEVNKKVQSNINNNNQLKAENKTKSVSTVNERFDVLPVQTLPVSNNESLLIKSTSADKTTDMLKRKFPKEQVKVMKLSLNNNEKNLAKLRKTIQTFVNSPLVESVKPSNVKSLTKSPTPKPDQINKDKAVNVLPPLKRQSSTKTSV